MTKYQIITPHTFLNELLGLPAKIQKTVLQKVKVLERDPISAQGDAKKLKNRTPPLYRVRIGDYRLIYTFDTGMGQTDRNSQTRRSNLPTRFWPN